MGHEDSDVASTPQERRPQGDAGLAATPSGGWSGVGFILDFEGRQQDEVAFIINVPGGAVTIHDLRKGAAAPEMYEALNELLYEDSDKSDVDRIVTRLKARAAIAKAEGRHD